jgi:predicted PhzF superfamily epimerase YddE/YHI9
MKIYFVDSFTNQKFKGNPAAVGISENKLDGFNYAKHCSTIEYCMKNNTIFGKLSG